MKPRIVSWTLLLLLTCTAQPVCAQTESCDDLTADKREVALSILKSQHPYDCCDATILECLSKKPVCPLATRLAEAVCLRVAADQPKDQIEQELSRRAESATGPRVEIDIGNAPTAGDAKAPVEIVVYLCARCPYCGAMTRALYESVTSGRLQGKAKIFVRPFVLRSHKGATAGAMAMMAAHKMGRFWDMLLELYENFNDFAAHKLPERAALLGMDASRFEELMDDPDIRNTLVESKKEGIRNDVSYTPTIFVNRRKYVAELSPHAVADFVEEEHERLAK